MPGPDAKGRLEVCCPFCRGALTIDAATGVVLHAAPGSGPRADFESVLGEIREAAGKREEQFANAFLAEKQRRAALDKKFDTAREKASENPDEKRINPLDID